MIFTLEDGREVEVKNINLVTGTVDYRRTNDGVYSGDCSINVVITDFFGVKDVIKAAIEEQLTIIPQLEIKFK